MAALALLTVPVLAHKLDPHTIAVGHHPDAVAVDPSSHTVYVVNNADDDVSVIDGTRRE
jgi:DNA-binding beta-propeller fold protein YncE